MRSVKFVLLPLFAILLLWSCDKTGLQDDDSSVDKFTEISTLIEADGQTLSSEDQASLEAAIASGENWESSTYTVEHDDRAVIDTRGPCDFIAGAQVLSSETPSSFSLTLGSNATVYGSNAVDDCVNQFKARAKFSISTTNNDKVLKLYTVNTSTNAENVKYIAVRNYCTKFSYLTGWTSGQIVAVNYCGW